MSKMILTTVGDTHVIVKRHFVASPEAVYGAHDPELIQQWMLGPEGWTMPVCINDARPAARSAMSGATARARDSTSPANSSNSNLTAASFT
jgi:uncharacterized protein YndB with AHSA1/START domain